MTDVSSERPKITAGLDLADNYSYLCLIDTHSGELLEEGRLRTTPEALRRRFASESSLRIALETGTHSPWASRVLEECGHEVLVANARKLRLIYANKRKTDEVDAENLARLARLDPKLLYPVAHRGEDSQAHVAIIRSRQALVGCRTQLVNHVRGAVKSFGAHLPKCPTRSFHREPKSTSPKRFRRRSNPSWGRSLRSPSASETTRGSWRRSPKSATRKPSSCARSREWDRSRRSPSCSPWRIPTASKRAAPWAPILWGWCPPRISRETETLKGAAPRKATRC
jgi:Transposase